MADLRGPTLIPVPLHAHVIFVHGLNGGSTDAWMSSGASPTFWPDWLQEDVPGVAVWSLGYPASATRWRRDGGAMALPDRAQNILPTLLTEPLLKNGPIVLVGYSLGGLVVKAVLRLAESKAPHDARVADFLRSVRGIVLLGTPNLGSDHASLANKLSWIARPSEALAGLSRNDPHLRDLNDWFRGFVPANDISALVLRETKDHKRFGMIVKPDSADPGLPVSVPVVPVGEDHETIRRPVDKRSKVYQLIREFVAGKLDGKHPDRLLADGLGQIETSVQALAGKIDTASDALLSGQEDIKQAIRRLSQGESWLVTQEAENRLRRLRQARFAAAFDSQAECAALIEAIEHGDLAAASQNARHRIFAWCARILASKDIASARAAFGKALQLGVSDEGTIAEALLLTFGDHDKPAALGKLAPIDSAMARSASLIIKAHDEELGVVLEWMAQAGIAFDDLDPDGKNRLIGLRAHGRDWAGALENVSSLKDADFREAPVLFSIAAAVKIAQAIPLEFREIVLVHLPNEMADFPLMTDAPSMAFRREAAALYRQASTAFSDLGIKRAENNAADYALWLELRDPETKNKARTELASSMSDAELRLKRLPMALAFGLKLDLEAVEKEIDRATALSGGKSIDAAIARFALLGSKKKAADVADYIQRHRAQLLEYYIPEFIDAIAIEALAKSGYIPVAREKLNVLVTRGVDAKLTDSLAGAIMEAEGQDPIALREAEYLSQPSTGALLNLVRQLTNAGDPARLVDYAGALFEAVKDVPSAETYTAALYELGREDEIVALAEQFPEIVEQSLNLQTTVSWAHYRLGHLGTASALLQALRAKRDASHDRSLFVNIAVGSGNWNSLAGHVEDEWSNKDKRQPDELLRAGRIAQRITATARSKDLIKAAAARANHDPHILSGCYVAATSAGWENDPEVHGWFEDAITHSGENGPLQRMELGELIEQRPSWQNRQDRLWDALLRGEAPMFAVGKVTNRTLLEMYLRTALLNLNEVDPRKRAIVFAYSGNRHATDLSGRRLGLDVTALLTLAFLGHLEKVLAWADTVVVAHTTMGWLFEERDRLAFHQPSLVARGRELKRLLDDKSLHAFEGSRAPPEIEMEVGDEIARYLVATTTLDETEKSQKVVVRPYPLHRPGSLLDEEANVTGYESHLAGCSDVIVALRRAGTLTAQQEAKALAHLQAHEKPWPHNPSIDAGATLYLDSLAVSYFEHLGLLGKIVQAGFMVFVSEEAVQRANELLRHEATAEEAQRIVEVIRSAIAGGIGSGKVVLGHLAPADDKDEFDFHPSRMLIAAHPNVDAVAIDDRFFNRHRSADDRPIVTSIDVLSALARDGVMSAADLDECFTALRRAGLIAIPHRNGEISDLLLAAEVRDGRVLQTAELRALREAILHVRMTDSLQIPAESAWLDILTAELLAALKRQWRDDIEDDVARAKSDWLLDLLDTRGWSHRTLTEGGSSIERFRVEVMMLLMNNEAPIDARIRYWRWLDDSALGELRGDYPELYRDLVTTVVDVLLSRLAGPPKEDGHDG